MNASSPSLSRPIELSSPEAVSTVRGGGLPIRAWGVIVLGMMPPSRAKGTNAAISRAYPNVPEATRIGLSSFRRLSSTCSSGNLVRPDGKTREKTPVRIVIVSVWSGPGNDTNPKRQRGNGLTPSLALRVNVLGGASSIRGCARPIGAQRLCAVRPDAGLTDATSSGA